MGLIKAATGSVGSTMADQWLETFRLDAFPNGVLSMRVNKTASDRSSNNQGDKDCISDGSLIIVNVGQCALAIDKGQIIGCYDTPGEHIYHSARSGSIFSKGGIKSIVRQSFDRFGYGGVAAVYQVIVYLDIKEHYGNPFSFKVPINLCNRHTGMSMDAVIGISGLFSFHITDPAVFYRKVCGSSTATILLSDILPQITAEVSMALTVALSEMCKEGVSAYEITLYISSLIEKAEKKFNEKWGEMRGLSLVSIGVDSFDISKEDKSLLQSVELAKALTDIRLAAGTLTGSMAQAMQDAAKN